MDIDGIALPHIVEHGLELGPVHTLAADFFGEPFLDAVLFERFDLAGFVLFFGADADVCNFHGSTSLVGRKIGSEMSETFENKAETNPKFQDFYDALDARYGTLYFSTVLSLNQIVQRGMKVIGQE